MPIEPIDIDASLTTRGRGRPPSAAILSRLVEAGLQILKTEPPSALTIERVCHVAHVSRATFYRRWKSITPVLAEIGIVILADANPFPDRSEDLRGDMLRAANNIALMLKDTRTASLFRYAFLRASEDEEIAQMLQDVDRRRSEKLISRIEYEQAVGRIRPDFCPDFIAHQLAGPIWLRILLLKQEPTAEFIESVVDTLYLAIACEAPSCKRSIADLDDP